MPDEQRAVSVITPAYKAQNTIGRAVASVLAQTHPYWEHLIVADDDTDYEAVLANEGLRDPRIRFLSSGGHGSGSPPARNAGLDEARYPVVAILDADDRLLPHKLAAALAGLSHAPIVSSALDVESADGQHLRTVGAGPNRLVGPDGYKFVNLSMDSMLVYDRTIADPRFNPDFPCLTDIEFLLRLFAHHEAVWHIGTPLHVYVKQPMSISNRPGASTVMVDTKMRLLKLLDGGAYPLADTAGLPGLRRFYELSLAAEETYGPSLTENPSLLFEDHLEAVLAAARA